MSNGNTYGLENKCECDLHRFIVFPYVLELLDKKSRGSRTFRNLCPNHGYQILIFRQHFFNFSWILFPNRGYQIIINLSLASLIINYLYFIPFCLMVHRSHIVHRSCCVHRSCSVHVSTSISDDRDSLHIWRSSSQSNVRYLCRTRLFYSRQSECCAAYVSCDGDVCYIAVLRPKLVDDLIFGSSSSKRVKIVDHFDFQLNVIPAKVDWLFLLVQYITGVFWYC